MDGGDVQFRQDVLGFWILDGIRRCCRVDAVAVRYTRDTLVCVSSRM